MLTFLFSLVFQLGFFWGQKQLCGHADMCNILALTKIFDKYGRVAIGIALFLKCECLHTSDIFNSLCQPKGKEESASTTI